MSRWAPPLIVSLSVQSSSLNAREHMHTDTLQTPWPSAAVLVTLHGRVSAHTSPLQRVCVCTFVRWEIQWFKPYNLCSVLHLDMFSRNAFKAINVCVNVPDYMHYHFTVWFQNVGIEGEFMSQLIYCGLSPSREQNLKQEELGHALHSKASLISLPTETWNWRMVQREEAVLFHPQVMLGKSSGNLQEPIWLLTQLPGKTIQNRMDL